MLPLRMEKRILFGFASKGGTGAAMAEEVYALASEAVDDSVDLVLPDELNNLAGNSFFLQNDFTKIL